MNEKIKGLGILLPEIYKDLAQPTVRNAGNALGEVADLIVAPIGLIVAPIGRCASILKKNLLRTIDKLDKEKPANIVPTATECGGSYFRKNALHRRRKSC